MTDSAVDPAALEFWCSTNSTPIEVATARTWPCYSAVSASAPAIRACCTSAPARRCIAVFVDGPHHDEPTQREADQRERKKLEDLGYRVIVIRYDAPLEDQIRRNADVFGPGLGGLAREEERAV